MDALLLRVARRRHAAFLISGECRLVRTERGFVPAQVVVPATPVTARRRCLDAVVALLGGASIPFFVVRGFDDNASVVAVPQQHRAAALAALQAESRNQPFYLAAVSGSRVRRPRAARQRRAWRRLRGSTMRVVLHVADPEGTQALGPGNGCDIEFWSEENGLLRAPRPNRATDIVPLASSVAMAHESTFTRAIAPHARSAPSYPTRTGLVGDLIDDITFPIDVVYTWVDGADPAWRARRDAALSAVAGPLPPRAANESRYVSRDELRYSFRSVHSFAPWVRHIWLVVDDQLPPWLDPDHEQISVVTHKELFGTAGKLPTFNSHAIESRLHHIEGLSEHFLYFNDDVFLGRLLPPQVFFEANGLSKIYLSTVKIDSGSIEMTDLPSTMAAKNNRSLIMQRFGRRVTFKMRHAPMALRRSVLTEIEEQYADELAETARHQFRHPDDVSLTSSLYQYYSFLSGRATIGELAYMYLNISAPETPAVLRLALMSRRFDVFCINDTESDAVTFPKQHVLMQDFVNAYFPVAAPWEKAGQGGREDLDD